MRRARPGRPPILHHHLRPGQTGTRSMLRIPGAITNGPAGSRFPGARRYSCGVRRPHSACARRAHRRRMRAHHRRTADHRDHHLERRHRRHQHHPLVTPRSSTHGRLPRNRHRGTLRRRNCPPGHLRDQHVGGVAGCLLGTPILSTTGLIDSFLLTPDLQLPTIPIGVCIRGLCNQDRYTVPD